MKKYRIISLILIVCICVLGLCGCQSGNDDVVATNDEMVMPTENNTTSKQPNEKEDMTGIVAGNSNVKVVEYDEKIASGLKAPEEVGGAVFTVLTTNITKNTLAKNIDNAETLVGIMKEYSNVLNTDVFNISYDETEKILEYFVCDFSTTYSFGSKVEMFMVSSPLFKKDVSYLIDDMKYDEKDETMYIFLTEGWPYYEEAHTEEQEKMLKTEMKKAKGANILFFNELNDGINPENYVLVMPK